MNILLINNGSKYPYNFLHFFAYADIDVFDTTEIPPVEKVDEYDLCILTGSSNFPIKYSFQHVKQEINMIQQASIPIVGICYGCELINVAFGGTLADKGAEEKAHGLTSISMVSNEPLLQKYSSIKVYEAHRWICKQVPEALEIIAISKYGPEIIRHSTKPIWGFQFHPEKMTGESLGDELLVDVIKHLVPTYP